MIRQDNMEKMDQEWVSGVYGTVQFFFKTSNHSFQRFDAHPHFPRLYAMMAELVMFHKA
jgi:hypothetical protein